jgi:formate C-acetyltransferase
MSIETFDASLKDIRFEPVDPKEPDKPSHPLMIQKYYYSRAAPEICAERPRRLTEYYKKNRLFRKMSRKEPISVLDRAKAFKYVFENIDVVVTHDKAYENVAPPNETPDLQKFDVRDSSPFAGSTTTKFKGVPIYPEFFGQMLWPELHTMGTREANPFHIDEADIDRLNWDIFPNWMEYTPLEIVRSRHYSSTNGEKGLNDLKLMQNIVFFITSKACLISHTIPDFSGPVNLGMNGMIEEAEKKRDATNDKSKVEFYSAVIEVLEGIIIYAGRLADQAHKEMKEAEAANDGDKAKRLREIERIYRRVPANPAETFREGLTTIWMCWMALHVENTNVALSLGRLDQLLYPLYKKDIEKGREDGSSRRNKPWN